MVQQEFCQACRQKNDCEKVYRKLGNAEGPPVTSRVVLAFLLPLIVFIAALGILDTMLPGATGVSLLLAVLITFACIQITRAIRRRFGHGG
jgi:hypothetical protein